MCNEEGGATAAGFVIFDRFVVIWVILYTTEVPNQTLMQRINQS